MSDSQMWAAIIEFFTENDWLFVQTEGELILNTKFISEHGDFICVGKVLEQKSQFVFYTGFPTKIPNKKRQTIAEVLTRANFGMAIGNFEMDLDEGEVFYKVGIDVENGQLTPALVENMVYACVFTMEKYFPAIMAVLYGDASPQDAIKKVEDEL